VDDGDHLGLIYLIPGEVTLRRSALGPVAATSWNPEAVLSRAEIAQRFERPGDALEDLRRYYGPAYTAVVTGTIS
jgi:hypothetical protein